MEFQSVVVAYSTDGSVGDLIENLRTGLETEVIQIDANHLEIRKSVTRADLEPIFAQSGASIVGYQKGVSPFTADEVKRILNEKVNALGMQDARINLLTPTGSEYPQYVRIELAGVDMTTAQEIVGTQGLFEIRVQTTGNETEHVLYGDQITSVGVPQKDYDGRWGVGFSLTDAGAEAFRGCHRIRSGQQPERSQPRDDPRQRDRLQCSPRRGPSGCSGRARSGRSPRAPAPATPGLKMR